MRTKALFCLAALAVGVISAAAQGNVYSLNIVGYYNAPTPKSLNALCVSLKTGDNRADQVIPYSDGDNIQVWTGTGWNTFVMDSGSSTGWTDGASEVPLTSLPTLGLGKGFFYGNNTAKATVTVVGEVATGTTTISVPSGLQAVGSMLPIGGLISAPTGVNLQVPDGSNVQFWTGSGWSTAVRDSGSSTGWTDGASEIAEPTITVGQGFFIGNNGAAFDWSQTLNP